MGGEQPFIRGERIIPTLKSNARTGFTTAKIFLIRCRTGFIPVSDQNYSLDESSQRKLRSRASTLATRLLLLTPRASLCSLSATLETVVIP
jgi:hypothetical protein